MKISTQLTERDKKLLIVLGVFLIAMAFIWFVIKPALGDISDIKSELVKVDMQKTEAENKIAKISEYETNISTLKMDLAKEARPYYSRMESQDIDNQLTNMALKAGFSESSLKQLKIEMPKTYASLYEYQSAQAIEAAKTQGQDQTVTPDPESASAQLKGIYCVKTIFTLEGDRNKLEKFIDTIVDDNESIMVSEISWLQSRNSNEYTLTLNLDVFMTDDK